MDSESDATSSCEGGDGDVKTSAAAAVYVTELRPHDVLLGRGTGPSMNEGNVSFRTTVEGMKSAYVSTPSRKAKRRIIRKAVKSIKARNGRFLSRLTKSEIKMLGMDPKEEVYEIVPDNVAIEKTKQAIRYIHYKKDNDPSSATKQSTPKARDDRLPSLQNDGDTKPSPKSKRAASKELPSHSSALRASDRQRGQAATSPAPNSSSTTHPLPLVEWAELKHLSSLSAYQNDPGMDIMRAAREATTSSSTNRIIGNDHAYAAGLRGIIPPAGLAASPFIFPSIIDPVALRLHQQLVNPGGAATQRIGAAAADFLAGISSLGMLGTASTGSAGPPFLPPPPGASTAAAAASGANSLLPALLNHHQHSTGGGGGGGSRFATTTSTTTDPNGHLLQGAAGAPSSNTTTTMSSSSSSSQEEQLRTALILQQAEERRHRLLGSYFSLFPPR